MSSEGNEAKDSGGGGGSGLTVQKSDVGYWAATGNSALHSTAVSPTIKAATVWDTQGFIYRVAQSEAQTYMILNWYFYWSYISSGERKKNGIMTFSDNDTFESQNSGSSVSNRKQYYRFNFDHNSRYVDIEKSVQFASGLSNPTQWALKAISSALASRTADAPRLHCGVIWVDLE